MQCVVSLVFLFVALWHDLEMRLLLWAALNAGFYALEVVTQLMKLVISST
jgi:hypothetical protein